MTAGHHRLVSASKYVVVIVTPRMTRQSKIDLIEILLMTEIDDTLKTPIEDHLTDDHDLQEFSLFLQDPTVDE